MTLVRMYLMTAASADGAQLGEALAALAAAVGQAPGSRGATLLQDRANPARYRFLEFWVDEESRKAAGAVLPKPVMDAVFGALSGKPESEDLVVRD
ncbi:MAG: antibiotic biosynthesis monooxygenase [Pseudomonadota bacterium]